VIRLDCENSAFKKIRNKIHYTLVDFYLEKNDKVDDKKCNNRFKVKKYDDEIIYNPRENVMVCL